MSPNGVVKSRIRQVGLTGMLLLTVLGARLYDLQVLQGKDYLKRANQNTIVVEPRPATRGRILDCHGEILVSNAPQFELVVTPSELRERKEVIKELSKLLDETEAELDKEESIRERNR